ncbi:serine hydrolase [Anabaena sp. FACHB-1237]|uniref:serine hydrolase n=1 Tax=Anabaena sp. FACHB-1237 TaxID=2692769 RepID=UPI00167FE40D|nr:serine hydrolase [Anabaena sp. FACHB-1237]MBD2138845.1 serine hydrolase [Anabaena sp. FACHB-1237]
MSESNKKIIPISRTEPSKQRRRQRQVSKTGDKKATKQKPLPSRDTGMTPTAPNQNKGTIAPGEKQPPSGVMIPTAFKPVPPVKEPGRGQVNRQISGQKPTTSGNTRLKTVRIEKPKVHRRTSRKTRLKPMAQTMLYALRLLIMGVGIGAIVGTVLSVLDPANRINTTTSVTSTNQAQKLPQNHTSSLLVNQEITDLKSSVQSLTTASAELNAGVFLLDLDNGNYVDINANTVFSAASTIKIPILIAFFQDVDAGKIRLDEMLTLEKEMIASGSGNMQYQEPGTKYTVLDVATKMITISDNTATNMLIAKLGGKDVLNQRFSSWGLTNTNIRNPLPDLEGTNTTSPKELGVLISLVSQGNFVSMRSRDLILDIMSRTERDNLIPAGLGKGGKAYHKTGDIGKVLADAGLIDIPNGKRYIASIMVARPKNDQRAATLINQVSSTAYQYFSQTQVTPLIPTNNIPTNNIPTNNIPTNIIPTNNTNNINNLPTTNYYPQNYR